MNLLLLLSALLSALAGVGASTRGPERSQAVAVVGVGHVATAAARARAASRPANVHPALTSVALFGVTVISPVLAAPLWIDRRRE